MGTATSELPTVSGFYWVRWKVGRVETSINPNGSPHFDYLPEKGETGERVEMIHVTVNEDPESRDEFPFDILALEQESSTYSLDDFDRFLGPITPPAPEEME